MKRLVFVGVWIILLANVAMAESGKPNPSRYAPNIFLCSDVEKFRILEVPTDIWRDGRKSGISLREWSALPDYCWAIQYTYVWNAESTSPGYERGKTDPEPVIVFVSDDGKVVGVQSKWHGNWLPINSSLAPWDFVDRNRRHIRVAFAGNVHTPAAGLLPSLAFTTAGKAPQWIARVVATGKVPNNDWVAAALKFLSELVRTGVVKDAGYRYPLK